MFTVLYNSFSVRGCLPNSSLAEARDEYLSFLDHFRVFYSEFENTPESPGHGGLSCPLAGIAISRTSLPPFPTKLPLPHRGGYGFTSSQVSGSQQC